MSADPQMGTGHPEETDRRRSLEDDYNAILQRVTAIIGHNDQMSTDELESAMQRLGLSPAEAGSYADFEERLSNTDAPTYGIYNTMEKPPGQHWFCAYKDYIYDPLGIDDSNTPEQAKTDENCGQRCLAYLKLCKQRGTAVRL